jgi:hypothetical protein
LGKSEEGLKELGRNMEGNDQLAFDFGVSWSTSMEKLHLLVGLSEWCKVAAKTVREPFLKRNYETLRSSMPSSDDEFLRRFSEMESLTEHVSSLYLADAAIVVFAHSVLDELINDALALSMKLDISIWQELILKWSDDKQELKYPLSTFRHRSFIDLLKERSAPYLKYLCSRSLHSKTQILLDVLIPSPELISDHQFKLKTLERLNTLRNTLIHEELLGQTLSVDDPFLTDLQLTGYFIHRLIVDRHSLNVFAVSDGIMARFKKFDPEL